jgi:hypothetical protein
VTGNPTILRIAAALIAIGTGLALANWYATPQSALAWAATLAMFAVMTVALRASRMARRDSTAAAVPGGDRIPTAVVFAALMIGIPLALSLARAYGFADHSDVGRRSTGVLIGLFLAMLGNVMPKNVPPLSSGIDGARQQAFHRLAGWTWVLCGLGSAIGWIALPIDLAQTAAVVLALAAMALTVGHFVRLARRAGANTPAA